MTAILLAVILVLGYHVESRHPIHRLTLIRESGYNLYFKIGYTGFGIVLYALIPACLVVLIMAVINGETSPSVLYTDKNLTEFFSTTLCISLMLFAVLIAKTRLWAAQKRFRGVSTADYGDDSKTIHSDDTKREMYNAVMRAANDMEREIILAARDLIPVRIILPNGKVYIGWPQQPDLQDGEIRHLRILPILSGFLNEKQTMVITRNYYRH